MILKNDHLINNKTYDKSKSYLKAYSSRRTSYLWRFEWKKDQYYNSKKLFQKHHINIEIVKLVKKTTNKMKEMLILYYYITWVMIIKEAEKVMQRIFAYFIGCFTKF